MPLVRYEVRCEHSLANPELFRSAARDDPEGLLEGVAMAGLVGIVRQLGDLAEFAAEVFRDLYEELTSVGGRAHDLTVRVQQLEAELPAVEKALLSEPNQLRFAYTNGADWHASIRSDQNHCTSGDLPRFVRNFYEECRGPPRLFLLDKFDVAGAGACLKRYSDPSFFKLEWARSELMKAKRAQRDKKARREKKKGRRRKTGQPIAAINQIPARVRYGSASLEDLDSLSHLLAPTLKNEVGSSSASRGANQGHGVQTQRRSNLSPQNKVVQGPLPPSGVPTPQAEGGASKSLKISAKDIEANVSGKFYQPNEIENAAESMAGKISKIIEMEDREAVPFVGLIPRNVDNKSPKSADGLKMSDSEVVAKGTNRVTREDPEAAAMGRTENTSRGISRGKVSKDGREGSNHVNWRVSQGRKPDVSLRGNASLDAKEEVNTGDSRTPSCRVPDDAGFAGSQANSSRTSSIDSPDPVQLSEKTSRRSSMDAKEVHVIAARFSRQNLGRSSRDGNDLGNGLATSASEDLSGVEGLTEQVTDTHKAEDRHDFAPTGNQLQSLPNQSNQANVSDAGHGVDEQRKHSIADAPLGDGVAPSTAVKSEGSLLSASGGKPASHDVHLSEIQGLDNNAVDTIEVSNNLEETVCKPPSLPPIRIEEIFTNEEESYMISATSPKASSQCSSPGENALRPSTSRLSRLSYSSELMPISSGSEPESPVSPNSPAFNALYSPPGSPSRISGFMIDSPPGIYMGSYSRTAHHSGYSSPGSEIPVLSLSPRSRLASPTPAPRADQGDHAGPSRPPPPLPIAITIPENSPNLDSRQEVRSVESQLYPIPPPPSNLELDIPTSSEADGLPSQSIDGLTHLASPQENAEKVHAEPASRSPGNPDLLHIGDHFKAPSAHIEQMQPSVAYSEAEVLSPSTTSTSALTEPSKSSSTSQFGLTNSGTMQPSEKSSVNLDSQRSTDSRSVDVPTDRSTSNIDLLTTPVGELEAEPFSVPLQGPTPNPTSSGLSVHPTPSPVRQTISIATPSFPVRDEESVPSSPTGSVIIKDTPSPPASPASNYSESESEIHEYHPSHDQPKSLVSPHSIAYAVEDVINHGETSSGDIGLHEDPTFKSSKSGPIATVSVQETGLANSVSENVVHAAHGLPEDRVEALASHTSTHLDISHEETLLQASPPTSSHLDSGPTGPLHSPEAAALRPISMTRSAPNSQNNSALNSPPGTLLGKEYSAGEDEASTSQCTRRSRLDSPSRTEIRVPSASSGRSASNSPPISPPKFLDRASSLKWRGRSDPSSLKPDFSLPPNLVCRSETSSPPCSPPPSSDLESPKQWDEVSEISNSLDSSVNVNVELYRLPDSSLPPDSPIMSEEGDHLAGPSSRLVSGEEEDIAPDHEHEMAETTTARSAFQHPSDFSDKSSFESLSSAPKVSHDGHQPSDAEFRPSTFEPSTKSVLPDSLSQVNISQQSTFESQTNPNSTTEAYEPPPLPPAPGSTDIPTKDALAAAISHHDWNMIKALSFQDPGHRPPPLDERFMLLEQIRTKSFNLQRTNSMEKIDPVIRPSANINVAAILEKANAIRQAFIGSDGEGDDEDDWSDS